MPIYEYECSACRHRLDALQKMGEDALTECPACHKAALQKQMSATSFQLKGTGWYATDFRTSQNTESTKGTETPAASAEPPPTKPTDTSST